MAGRPRPVTRKTGGLTPIQLAASQRGKGNAFDQLFAGALHAPKPFKEINSGRVVNPKPYNPTRGFGGGDLPLNVVKPIHVAGPSKDFGWLRSKPHRVVFSKFITGSKLNPAETALFKQDIARDVQPYRRAADSQNVYASKNSDRTDFVKLMAQDVRDQNLAKTLSKLGDARLRNYAELHPDVPKKDWYDNVTGFLKGAVGDLASGVGKGIASGFAGLAVAPVQAGSSASVAPVIREIAVPKLAADVQKSVKGKVKSGGLGAMEQYARLPHAILGGVTEGLDAGLVPSLAKPKGADSNVGKAILRGVYKGAVENHPYGGGEIIRNQLGIKNKVLSGTAGFLIDAATDPATYVMGGAGAAGRTASRTAIRRVASNSGVQAARKAQIVAATNDARVLLEQAAAGRGVRASNAIKRAEASKGAPLTKAEKTVIENKHALKPQEIQRITDRAFIDRGLDPFAAVVKNARKGAMSSPLAQYAGARAERAAYVRGANWTYAGKSVGRQGRDQFGLNVDSNVVRRLGNGKAIQADKKFSSLLGRQVLASLPKAEAAFDNGVRVFNNKFAREANFRNATRDLGASKIAVVRPSTIQKYDWERLTHLKSRIEADKNNVIRSADQKSKTLGKRLKVDAYGDFIHVMENDANALSAKALPREYKPVAKRLLEFDPQARQEIYAAALAKGERRVQEIVGGENLMRVRGEGLTGRSAFERQVGDMRARGVSEDVIKASQMVRQLPEAERKVLIDTIEQGVAASKHGRLVEALHNMKLTSKQLKNMRVNLLQRNLSPEDIAAFPVLKEMAQLSRETQIRIVDIALAQRLLAENPEWDGFNGLVNQTRQALVAGRRDVMRQGKPVAERSSYFPHVDLEHLNKSFDEAIQSRRLGMAKGRPISETIMKAAENLGLKEIKTANDINILNKLDPQRFGASNGGDLAGETFLSPRRIEGTATEINSRLNQVRQKYNIPFYQGVSINVPRSVNAYMRAMGREAAVLTHQRRVLDTLGKSLYGSGTFAKDFASERVMARVTPVLAEHSNLVKAVQAASDPAAAAAAQRRLDNFALDGSGLPARPLSEAEYRQHAERLARLQQSADKADAEILNSQIIPRVEAAAKLQSELFGRKKALERGSWGEQTLAGRKMMPEEQRNALRAVSELFDAVNGTAVRMDQLQAGVGQSVEALLPYLADKYNVDFALLSELTGNPQSYKKFSGSDLARQAEGMTQMDEMARKFLLDHAELFDAFTAGGVPDGVHPIFNGLNSDFLTEWGPDLGHPQFTDRQFFVPSADAELPEFGENMWALLEHTNYNDLRNKLTGIRDELNGSASEYKWSRRVEKRYPGNAIALVARAYRDDLGRDLTPAEAKKITSSLVLVHRPVNGGAPRELAAHEVANVLNDSLKARRVHQPVGNPVEIREARDAVQEARNDHRLALREKDRILNPILSAKPGDKIYEQVFAHAVRETEKARVAKLGRELTPYDKQVVAGDVSEHLATTDPVNWPLPPALNNKVKAAIFNVGYSGAEHQAARSAYEVLAQKVWKTELDGSYLTRAVRKSVRRDENGNIVMDAKGNPEVVSVGGLGGGQVYAMEKTHFAKLLVDPAIVELGKEWPLFAKAMGSWKWVVTQAVPAFWVRNMLGDAQNSVLAQGGISYLSNMKDAYRVARYIRLLEKHERQVNHAAIPNAKLERLGSKWIDFSDNTASGIARRSRRLFTGGDHTLGGNSVAEIARWSLEDGVANAGITGRDIAEVVHHVNKPTNPLFGTSNYVRRVRATAYNEKVFAGKDVNPDAGITKAFGKRSPMASMESWSNFRENFAGRMNTYIGGLEQSGGSRAIAERLATRHHFDYGNLSTFEKTLRNNLMPFYTWNSRNLPLWTAALWERPGLIANFQMARQESSQAAGIDPNYESNIPLGEQMAFPFVAKVGDSWRTLSMGSTGLSISSLNQSPASLATDLLGIGDVSYLNALKDFVGGLIRPDIKIPVEMSTNYSFFMHRQIKPPSSPLTAAPKWTGVLKNFPTIAATLGWNPTFYNRTTGKQTGEPSWSRSTDYLASQLPGVFGVLFRTSREASNNPVNSFDPKQSLLAFATGLRIRKYEPKAFEYNALKALRANLEAERSRIHQQRNFEKGAVERGGQISSYNPTKKYTQVSELLGRVEEGIAAYEDYFHIPRSGNSTGSRSSGRSMSNSLSSNPLSKLSGGASGISSGLSSTSTGMN